MYNNCPGCGSYNAPGTQFCDCGHALNGKSFVARQAKARNEAVLFNLLKRTSQLMMLVSALTFAVTFPFKKSLPEVDQILELLYSEPIQTDADVPEPFEVHVQRESYLVTPRFYYEIYGLVVSHHHADSVTDVLHEKWDDYLNIKDICVVWGPNIQSGVYLETTYSSGNFTCFCKFRDRATMDRFDWTAMSNNHLLSDNAAISRRILNADIGDQIAIRGFLSKYENARNGFKRDTSTTRTDTGNGACETIYVTDFEILKAGSFIPRLVNYVSGGLFCVALILFLSLAFLFPKQK
ncbi:MAG: hypothetical protein CSA81_10580 [Acidobacteria bacterium]|nr:MAG: hypothetical protein CSA81_10580 [Acidobacteriota bacterium]